jgi:diguanylate cyclase (GGDEF)-like protein/PAS domain S-box-containing protein
VVNEESQVGRFASRRGLQLRRALDDLSDAVGREVLLVRREFAPGIWRAVASSTNGQPVLNSIVRTQAALGLSAQVERVASSLESLGHWFAVERSEPPFPGGMTVVPVGAPGRRYALCIGGLGLSSAGAAIREAMRMVDASLANYHSVVTLSNARLLIRSVHRVVPMLSDLRIDEATWSDLCIQGARRLLRGTACVSLVLDATYDPKGYLVGEVSVSSERLAPLLREILADDDLARGAPLHLAELSSASVDWRGPLGALLDRGRGVSFVVIPLLGPDRELLGIIVSFAKSRHRYNEVDILRLQILADVMSGGLVTRRQHARVVQEANYHRYLARALDQSVDGMMIADLLGRVIYANAAVGRLVGSSPSTLLGHTPDQWLLHADGSSIGALLEGIPERDVVTNLIIRGSGGVAIPVDATWTSLRDDRGVVDAHMVSLSDASRSHDTMNSLRAMANEDPLTGLFNRRASLEYLEKCLGAAHGRSDVAVIFIDIDRFKSINDTFGHRAGDELLQIIAARLRGVLRDNDLAGRLGGDEFVVILSDVESRAHAQRIAGRIATALFGEPVTVLGHTIRFAASLGVAYAEHALMSPDELISSADQAMYRSKHSARAVAVSGGAARNTAFGVTDHEVAERLVLALQDPGRAGLRLNYSPIVDLEHFEVRGVGTIMVFDDPLLGSFDWKRIEAAAIMSRQVARLIEWLIDEASQDVTRWLRDDPYIMDRRTLAIDVFRPILFDRSLLSRVLSQIQEKCLTRSAVTIEIADSALAQGDPVEARAALLQIAASDLSIAIDDFGSEAPLRFIVDVAPAMIKVAPSSPYGGWAPHARELEVIAAVTSTLGASLIAKRVDTTADRDVVLSSATLVQPGIANRYEAEELPRVIRAIERGVLPWLR